MYKMCVQTVDAPTTLPDKLTFEYILARLDMRGTTFSDLLWMLDIDPDTPIRINVADLAFHVPAWMTYRRREKLVSCKELLIQFQKTPRDLFCAIVARNPNFDEVLGLTESEHAYLNR